MYCPDIGKSVYIEGFSNVYVANAFSPDADGINDNFKPSLYGITPENYLFRVFDRWGLLIYSTNNINDEWNGVYDGKTCQQDVYVWKVDAIDKYTDEPINMIGHVTLVK